MCNFREIHQAVQNLVDPNKWFADAVDARQVSRLFFSGSDGAEILCSHDSVLLVVAIETRIWCHWFPFSFFPFLLTDNWYRHFVGMVDDYLSFLQEIDLRIGASFTRFQTMLMRDAFIIDTVTDDRNLVLSYGPCQVCLC